MKTSEINYVNEIKTAATSKAQKTKQKNTDLYNYLLFFKRFTQLFLTALQELLEIQE